MIPLVGGAAVLPQVESTGLRQNNIAVTINQLKSITSSPSINASFSQGIRFVSSRAQTRRSSLSSLCSLMKFEEEELGRLNSRGSSVGICGRGLRNCLETKQLSKERDDENSPCSSTDSKEVDDPENSSHSMTIINTSSVGTDTTQEITTTTITTKSKFLSKSNSKTRTKKSLKGKKSAKRKENVKKLKVPSVFERLANATKNKENSSNSQQKNTSTIFYNKSCGNLLEIKRLQATYMPVLKPSKPKTFLCLPKVSMSKTTNKITAETPREASRQSAQTIKSSHSIVVSPRKSQNQTISHEKSDCAGTRKVYLSEVQSYMVDGIPGAPPATPFPDDQTPVEYIPCLMDIKSQRAVKSKLEKIATRLKSEDQQRKENAMKENQKRQKEIMIKLKHQQRAEIYALNKVMTKLENQNFQKFMMKKEAISSMGV